MKARFWVSLGQDGRVYDVTMTLTGEAPVKKTYTPALDHARWFELVLKEPFLPWQWPEHSTTK